MLDIDIINAELLLPVKNITERYGLDSSLFPNLTEPLHLAVPLLRTASQRMNSP